MIIKRLWDYYQDHKKEKDPDGNLLFPKYGYEIKRVAYQLLVLPNGNFYSLQSTDMTKVLPDLTAIGKVVTRAIVASYYAGTMKYVFGCDLEEKKEEGKKKVKYIVYDASADKQDAFIALHKEIYEATKNKNLKAVLTFLEHWKDTKDPDVKSKMDEVMKTGGIIVLGVYNEDTVYLCEEKDLMDYWEKKIKDTPVDKNLCLITGERKPTTTLHGKIMGVKNASSTGASLVSFNSTAHESFGRKQGDNAPIGCDVAFGYRAVLNLFLKRGGLNNCLLGENTLTFWTKSIKNNFFCKVLGWLFDRSEDDETPAEIKSALVTLRKGLLPDTLPKEESFCLAVLAGNRGRIFVQDFIERSLGEMADAVGQHCKDVALPGYEAPSIGELVFATKSERSRKIKPSPSLYPAMLRSVLTGDQYPHEAYIAACRHYMTVKDRYCEKGRHTFASKRVAIIKGYLNRKCRQEGAKEFSMNLDCERTDVAYLLGRMLAVSERIQYLSDGRSPNKSVSDKYLGSLGDTPQLAFKDVHDITRYRLAKIRRDKPWIFSSLDKAFTDIVSSIGQQIPVTLDVIQQGIYILGYNQQRQENFKPKQEEAGV